MCHRAGIKRNSLLSTELSDVSDRFDLKMLDLGQNYLGKEGVRAVLAVACANQLIEHIGLSGQGVDDACLSEIIKVLRDHPRITSVDLSMNPGITNASATGIFSLLKDNTMLCEMNVEGCSIAAAFKRKMKQFTDRNTGLEPLFFRGNYLQLKVLFMQLDSDRSGYLTMSELLTNIEIPKVANTLLARLQQFSDQREAVTINDFLDFVYPHYKSEAEIKKYSREDDTNEVHTARNHLTLFNCLTKNRLVAEHYKKIRVFDRTMADSEVARMVDRAMEVESTLHADGVPQQGGRLVISYHALKKGLEAVWKAPQLSIDDIRKDFRLPPTIVKQICLLFAVKNEVTIAEVLSQNLETTLTKLQLRVLLPIVQRFGLPIQDALMSLQETVTLLEEYYDSIVYEKV